MSGRTEETRGSRINYKWQFPRTSWAVFSFVSAITTSLGMTETFFDGDLLTGAAIAVAIQLLLVWMNNKMPLMIRNSKSKWGCALLVVIYLITALWSILFSFVYICNHVYTSVYMKDDQEQLVKTYQENIVLLDQYTESDFNETLDKITEKISSLKNTDSSDANGSEEKSVFEMSKADLESLEDAFSHNAEMKQLLAQYREPSLVVTDDMTSIVDDAKEEIEKEISDINDKITQFTNEIVKQNKKIRNISVEKSHISRATTADQQYQKQIDGLNQQIDELEEDKSDFEKELKEKNDILHKLEELISILSVLKDNVDNSISVKFAEILVEIGKTEIKIEEVNSLADEIHGRISKEIQKDGDHSAYVNIFKACLELKQYLGDLAQICEVQTFCKQEHTIIEDTGKYVTSYASVDNKNNWVKKWNESYVDIKNNFFKLPSSNEEEIKNAYVNISKLQRDCLMELNQIERSKYYLFGPHPILAWLSFLLAMYLDINPLAFMIVRIFLKKSTE